VVDEGFIRRRPHMRSNHKRLISLIRQELTGLRELIFTRIPRFPIRDGSGFVNLTPKQVVVLKDIQLVEKEPLGGCYLRCCEGEVDKSPDTRRWIVYPNTIWELGVNYLRRLDRKKGYGSGPLQFDYFRRRVLINRLRGHARRRTKVDRENQPPTDLAALLPVQDPSKPATRSNCRRKHAMEEPDKPITSSRPKRRKQDKTRTESTDPDSPFS
jgi:hypothetical protein